MRRFPETYPRFAVRRNLGAVAGAYPLQRLINPNGSGIVCVVTALVASMGLNSAGADKDATIDWKLTLNLGLLTAHSDLKNGGTLRVAAIGRYLNQTPPKCILTDTTQGGTTTELTLGTGPQFWSVKVRSKEPYDVPVGALPVIPPGTAMDVQVDFDTQVFLCVAWVEVPLEDFDRL